MVKRICLSNRRQKTCLISGSGISLGEENGNPSSELLLCGKSHGQRSLLASVHGVTKSQIWLGNWTRMKAHLPIRISHKSRNTERQSTKEEMKVVRMCKKRCPTPLIIPRKRQVNTASRQNVWLIRLVKIQMNDNTGYWWAAGKSIGQFSSSKEAAYTGSLKTYIGLPGLRRWF